MITVGVRDLKNQLSQYLQYIKRGEKIIITEHNRVIAEISSPLKEVLDTDVQIILEKLTAEGKLIKAKKTLLFNQKQKHLPILIGYQFIKKTENHKMVCASFKSLLVLYEDEHEPFAGRPLFLVN